jgi:FAD/FMN-containing dehydrogenase
VLIGWLVGKVNAKERSKTSVHPIWADARTVFSLGIDWHNDATPAERKRLKGRLVNASLDLEGVVGQGGGTYVNEANPYEPNWQSAFWGSNYERLLRIKRRVDPRNLMVCNRCVGTDIVYES